MRISRRRFLAASAAGAGALAAPALFRASADPRTPRRFVFFVSGNGFDASVLLNEEVRGWIGEARGRPFDDARWYGTGYSNSRGFGGNPSLVTFEGLTGAPALGELGELEGQTAVLLGLSQRGATGGHSAAHGVLAARRTVAKRAGGRTIDDQLARLSTVRGDGARISPVPALRLGVDNRDDVLVSYDTCAFGPGQPLPLLLDPGAAWDAYVGPLALADGAAWIERRTRLLEFAQQDARRAVARVPAGLPSRQAIAYEASVAALLENQRRFAEVIDASRGLALPPRPEAGLSPLDAMRAQVATLGAALRSGLTNVGVMGFGAGPYSFNFRYRVGPVTEEKRHPLCHAFASEDSADLRAELREVWRQEIAMVIGLARELADTPEVDASGSMLDHTVLVYLADNGVGHHAWDREHPVLLLGGQALGLHTGGRTVVFPEVGSGPEHRQLSNLWNTLGGPVAGHSLETFGDDLGRVAPGPLPALLA